MAIQKQVDLNQPLDADKQTNLSKSALKPELTEAAITLHGDHYKQSQAKLNKYILTHPFSIFILTLTLPIALGYTLWDYFLISDNLVEFWSIINRNRNDFIYHLLATIPIIGGVLSIFGGFTYLVGEEMGIITNKFIGQKYCDYIFGFDIRAFAKGDKESNENSEIIVYRDSPIAIGTIVIDESQSTVENFIVKITGIHVRKVFQKAEFDQLLIDWAVLRSRKLYQEYLKKNKSKIKEGSIVLTIDGYSFDPHFENILISKGFKKLSSSFELNPFNPGLTWYREILHKFFNISRDTFGLILITSNEDYELIKNINN
ncbi:unnamed protein product [Candida verbasci]|uniref:Inorganic phosphate transporter PHO86 n=1 Tax=Candida verbasci TaxID=1227364 RepID=A0A9W4TV47_9ASCO|nr:unnamed protein product [Candida verbasci]